VSHKSHVERTTNLNASVRYSWENEWLQNANVRTFAVRSLSAYPA